MTFTDVAALFHVPECSTNCSSLISAGIAQYINKCQQLENNGIASMTVEAVVYVCDL